MRMIMVAVKWGEEEEEGKGKNNKKKL